MLHVVFFQLEMLAHRFPPLVDDVLHLFADGLVVVRARSADGFVARLAAVHGVDKSAVVFDRFRLHVLRGHDPALFLGDPADAAAEVHVLDFAVLVAIIDCLSETLLNPRPQHGRPLVDRAQKLAQVSAERRGHK